LYRIWLVLIAMLFLSCRSTAQIVVLAIVSDPSGITLTGSGSSAAVMTFGTVQAFGGTVPSGVTKTVGANNWTLTTPIDLQVTQLILMLSPNYNLTAQLMFADAQNTWKLNSVTLSTAASTITAAHAYGTAAYTFSLTIPFSAAAGLISNTINLTATAN
jgi:hypothetical protein